MSGSVGNTALALESWKYPVNSNQDAAKISVGGKLNPFFLSAYLNCRFHVGLEKSERLSRETEELLFSALGLKSWSPNDSPSCTRSAGDVFAANRFDAEYFRPRYQSLLKLLRRQGKTLRDVARLREDTFTPPPGQRSPSACR